MLQSKIFKNPGYICARLDKLSGELVTSTDIRCFRIPDNKMLRCREPRRWKRRRYLLEDMFNVSEVFVFSSVRF